MAIRNPHVHAARERLSTLDAFSGQLAHDDLVAILHDLFDAVDYEPPRPSIDQGGDPGERAAAAAGAAHLALLDLQARLISLRSDAVDDDERAMFDLATSSIELVGSIGIGIIHALRAQTTNGQTLAARLGRGRPAGAPQFGGEGT